MHETASDDFKMALGVFDLYVGQISKSLELPPESEIVASLTWMKFALLASDVWADFGTEKIAWVATHIGGKDFGTENFCNTFIPFVKDLFRSWTIAENIALPSRDSRQYQDYYRNLVFGFIERGVNLANQLRRQGFDEAYIVKALSQPVQPRLASFQSSPKTVIQTQTFAPNNQETGIVLGSASAIAPSRPKVVPINSEGMTANQWLDLLTKTCQQFNLTIQAISEPITGPAWHVLRVKVITKSVKEFFKLEDDLYHVAALPMGTRFIKNSGFIEIQIPGPLKPVVLTDSFIPRSERRGNPTAPSFLYTGLNSRSQYARVENVSNVLVTGRTNSGKSNFLKALALSICLSNSPEYAQICLIRDPLKAEMDCFLGSPWLWGDRTWYGGEETVRVLEILRHEMEERYKAFEEAGRGVCDIIQYNEWAIANGRPVMPRLYIIFDEFKSTQEVEKKKYLKRIQDGSADLARICRAAGMHLIISTQKPTHDCVPTELRENLPTAFVFPASPSTSKIGLENNDELATRLRPGEFICRHHGDREILQALYIPLEIPEAIAESGRQGYRAVLDRISGIHWYDPARHFCKLNQASYEESVFELPGVVQAEEEPSAGFSFDFEEPAQEESPWDEEEELQFEDPEWLTEANYQKASAYLKANLQTFSKKGLLKAVFEEEEAEVWQILDLIQKFSSSEEEKKVYAVLLG